MSNFISLNIQNGQGLTQALQSYVTSNKDYEISGGSIDKTEWNATISELEKIQNERKTNNGNPIFSGGSENGNWHKNMLTKEGQVDLSEDEMSRLLSKMGVKNKKFDNWCTESAKSIDSEKTTADKIVYNKDVKEFDMVGDEYRNDINNNGAKNAGTIYKAKALKTADDEIALYDKNNDGQIDIEEMEERNKKDFEEQFGQTDAEGKRLQDTTSENTLKYLDLDGDGKIDDKEYAAYLNAIDSNNDKEKSNGRISRDEYASTKSYANDYVSGMAKEKTHEKATKSELLAGDFRGKIRRYYKSLFGSDPAAKK